MCLALDVSRVARVGSGHARRTPAVLHARPKSSQLYTTGISCMSYFKYLIAKNFRGRKFVAIRESFLREIWGVASFGAAKEQSAKFFSLESLCNFPSACLPHFWGNLTHFCLLSHSNQVHGLDGPEIGTMMCVAVLALPHLTPLK